jgi:hypothetical protein
VTGRPDLDARRVEDPKIAAAENVDSCRRVTQTARLLGHFASVGEPNKPLSLPHAPPQMARSPLPIPHVASCAAIFLRNPPSLRAGKSGFSREGASIMCPLQTTTLPKVGSGLPS